jgi:hypothetical protein
MSTPLWGRWNPTALTSHNAPGGAIDPTGTPDVGSARGQPKGGRFGVNPG